MREPLAIGQHLWRGNAASILFVAAQEAFVIDWAIDQPRRLDTIEPQGGEKGHGLPSPNVGLPGNGGHLMVSSQGSEVTNGDEDPAIIYG